MPDAIVSLENFITASRDIGYRSLSTALAELIDNSIQAGAAHIEILVRETQQAGGLREITIGVVDDGEGMDSPTLRSALSFGGSSRFNDRSSLGRFCRRHPHTPSQETSTFAHLLS